ncbi:MAG TPA: GAF domain-containing sensor histidine kinase [Anaerolineae bacterium]
MTQSDTETLERRNRELSILNTIARALNREVDLQRTLETVLAQVAALLDLRTGWVWLLRDGPGGESYLAAAQNLPPGLAQDPERMAGSCYCLDTYRAGDLEGAANVNVITCSRLRSLVDGTDGLRYHASIPLSVQGRKLGVLNVASPDWRELAPEDLRLLYIVGDLLGIAIQRARLFAQSVHFGAVEERNRLAREIHDTLAQGLTGIVLQLEAADALLEAETTPSRAQVAVAEALALARSNLEEARRSMYDLRTAPLEGRTLDAALADLAAEQAAAGGLAIEFSARGAGLPLPLRLEAGLYRIAQEALANVIRHAHARHATVTLAVEPERVRLAVTDDGRGFDPARLNEGGPRGHYGLLGLRERARLLGGTLTLQSSPGRGAHVEVVLPRELS